MKILGIETSCDDTGIAILDVINNGNFKVLSNIVASQINIHKEYGGVFPAMAKREHQRNLLPTLISALRESKLLKPKVQSSKQIQNLNLKTLNFILEREPELLKKIIPFLQKYDLSRNKAGKPNIDAIAVTNGPGLEPCLWVGVNFAKALSYFWDIPIVEINHIKAHIFVNTINNGKNIEELKPKNFPLIALVVSGGHTQLVLMKELGKYEIIGETRDDAAGECFDKCAKILGLAYPGGPIISKLAEGIETKKLLPRPMIGTKDYDFSFSGLKTAVLYADRKVKNKNKEYKKQMAAEVQQAIIDVLLKKTLKAIKDFKAKTLILGGGVTANKELREQFQQAIKNSGFLTAVKNATILKILIPSPGLSTDNGLMVAITGYFKAKKGKFSDWKNIKAEANLRVE